MKRRLLLVVSFLAVLASLSSAQFKNYTIPQLNIVPLDSLKLLDSLQASASTTLDDTQPTKINDTVRVVGIVTVKPRLLTYTLARYNMYIQDTTTGQLYGGLNILTNDTSAQAQSTLITALDTGMVVRIVGRALEFGSQPNSLTEMYAYSASTPIFTSPSAIEILSAGAVRPQPKEVTCDSFAVGTKPLPSRGEKYEGMYVVIRNVTVNSVDLTTGRFTFVDAAGDQMTMYDGSGYYTLRGHKITGSKYTAPPVGTKLSYIRGIIIPQAKTGTCGEYNIMPLYPGKGQLASSTYPGDIVIDKFAPSITNLNRFPTNPKSTDAIQITFKAANLNAGAGIDSGALYYQVGSKGSWIRTKLTLAGGDSLYRSTIPASAKDSIVSYYVSAYGSDGTTGNFPDVTVPFFYRVRDNGLSIFDLQYTPYSNGVSGFSNDTVTVSAVVTVDTTDYVEIPTSGLGANRPRVFLAGGAGAWNGIAAFGNTAGVGLDTVKRGGSISVTAILSETNSRTVLQVLSFTKKGTGVVPTPPVVSISGAGSLSYQLSNMPVDGNPTFEQWEGVVIQINNPFLALRNADNLNNTGSSNFGEYFIASSYTAGNLAPFGVRVDDNGNSKYYADTSSAYTAKPSNAVLIPLGAKVSYIRGVLDYSFGEYKLEPRKDDDFGTITGVVEKLEVTPTTFELSQNYPNPFNPSTSIRYALPVNGKVTLKVYNVLGQLVSTLVNEEQATGTYVARFDASRLASGMYIYRLQVGNYSVAKKMMLLK